MIYLLPNLKEFLEEDLSFLYPYLSEQRQKKISSYRFFSDKISSACAFLLLRILLQKEGLPTQPFLEVNDNGKPFLHGSDYCFSLSHDRNGVLCALSKKNIGCDIQTLIPFEKELAETILSDGEQKLLPYGKESEYITTLWAMKESYGKYKGDGIFAYLRTTDFPFFFGIRQLFDGLTFQVGKRDSLYFSVCGEKKEEMIFLDKELFYKKVKKLPK